MSTFASVARTALTISNALNLAQLRGANEATERSRILHEIAEAYRDYNRAIKEGDEEGAQRALENLGILKNELAEFEKNVEYQAWQDFLTQANVAILSVSTIFNTLLKSESIRGALFKAASTLGTLFGGVFTGFSTLVMKAGQWLWAALFAPSVASKSAIGGATHGGIFAGAFNTISTVLIRAGAWLKALFLPQTISRSAVGGGVSGTAFGTAFGIAAQVAIIAALVAIIAAAVDVIIETFTGRSFVRDITDAIFGKGEGFSVRDFLGIPLEGFNLSELINNDFSATTLFENEVPPEIKIKPVIDDSGIDGGIFGGIFGSNEGEGISIDTPDIQSLLGIFNKELPEAYSENENSFNQSWLENIPNSLAESTTIITSGFNNLWNSIIGATNFAGESLTSGLNTIFAGLIAHMNRLIDAYNRAAKKIGKPTIANITFTPSTFTPVEGIPAVAAARGFKGIVDRPTLFLAGEAGPESVNITPNATSQGSSTVTVINVQGSIMAEKELLSLVDNDQKSRLKRRGFTGF